MIKVTLIRHFATQGNLQKRYLGTTDEPLCEEGKQRREEIHYPEVEVVISSPMKRCVETAKLIYPSYIPILQDGLRECDFGDFEYKNYHELRNNTMYQEWVDSNGTLPFPGGEDMLHFLERSVKAFNEMITMCLEKEYKSIGFVVHGGTIMSILHTYSHPNKEYYHWQAENGCGYTMEMNEEDRRLINICTIH